MDSNYNLQQTAVIEIGLKFPGSVDDPFLKIGVTFAIFHEQETAPK